MIELRGLRKTFADGTEALRHIDLDIGRGLFGLLGPNGAGKTTLMSILVLALEPSGGSISYDGRDAATASYRRELRARIGFLPQSFAPLRLLSGREYLSHCLRLRRPGSSAAWRRERVQAVLDVMGLTSAGDRLASTYSGGMRRRLGLAQALVHEPDLLVIDEPTAGLDPEERIRFRNLIAEVGGSATVVLSTHIVEDIEATCGRIGVVVDGRLTYTGAPTELLRRIAGRLWSAGPGTSLPPGAVDLGARADEGGGARRIFVAPGPVAGAEPREPSLESAYLAFLAGAPPAGSSALCS